MAAIERSPRENESKRAAEAAETARRRSVAMREPWRNARRKSSKFGGIAIFLEESQEWYGFEVVY